MFDNAIIKHEAKKQPQKMVDELLKTPENTKILIDSLLNSNIDDTVKAIFSREKLPDSLPKAIADLILTEYTPEITHNIFKQSNQATYIHNKSQALIYANKLIMREVLLGNVDNSVSHFYLNLPVSSPLSQYMESTTQGRIGESTIRLNDNITLVSRNLGTYGALGSNYRLNNLTPNLARQNQFFVYYYPEGESTVKKEITEQAKVAEDWDNIVEQAQTAGLQQSQIDMLQKIQSSSKQKVDSGGQENEDVTTTVEIK